MIAQLLLIFACVHFIGCDVYLKYRTIETNGNSFSAGAMDSNKAIPEGSGPMILVVDDSMKFKERKELFEKLELTEGKVRFLNNGGYIVHGNYETVFAKANLLNEVVLVDLFYPSDKSRMEVPYVDGKRRSIEGGKTELLVRFFPSIPEDLDLPEGCVLKRKGKYGVAVFEIDAQNEEHAKEIEDYLFNQEFIISFEEVIKNEIKNNYGTRLLQSRSSTRPLYSAPWYLSGNGLVIGILDTGLNMDHCYFYESGFTFNDEQATGKVKKYTNKCQGTILGDYDDEVAGHGTHVAGSAAGKAGSGYSSFSTYEGAAPNARIYFIDGGVGSSLSTPSTLEDLMAEYQGQANISSNSWGCGLTNWVSCAQSDTCDCTWTITRTAPKYGGRVVVGQDAIDSDCRMVMEDSGYIVPSTMSCCQMCNLYDTNEQNLDDWLHDNYDVTVVFAAGNDGMISSGYGLVGKPATAKNIISVGASDNVNAAFNDGYYTPESRGYYYDSGYYNQNNLAPFSSRGRTSGLVKPDIVGPGYVVTSAYSRGDTVNDSYCEDQLPSTTGNDAAFYTTQGTSMATPLISGTLALLSEYLRDNYSPAIEQPANYLLKALLIHSAIPLTGGYYGTDYTRLLATSWHNPEFGFGFPQLNRIINQETGFELFVDQEVDIDSEETMYYCFHKDADDSSSHEFRVTIAWNDPSGDHSRNLVNDIDLELCKTDGSCWPANDNYDDYEDTDNNVEQVRAGLGVLKSGDEFMVKITAKTFPSPSEPSQRIGLVWSGYDFTKDDCATYAYPLSKTYPYESAYPRDRSFNAAATKVISFVCILVAVVFVAL